jgi:hypothetical protein
MPMKCIAAMPENANKAAALRPSRSGRVMTSTHARPMVARTMSREAMVRPTP